jgi:hypothetical protein
VNGEGFEVHPDEIRAAGSAVGHFGGLMSAGGQKLEEGGQALLDHARGDNSGVGAIVAEIFGLGLKITGKVFEQGGRVATEAGQRLGQCADTYQEADQGSSDRFSAIVADLDPEYQQRA